MFIFMFNFLNYILEEIKKSIKTVFLLLKYIRLYTYDILSYVFGTDINIFNKYDEEKNYKILKKTLRSEKFFQLSKSLYLLENEKSEINFSISYYYIFKTNILVLPKIFYRIKNYNFKPYTYNNYTYDNYYSLFRNNMLGGLKSINKVLRKWILSLILFIISIYFLSLIRVLPVNTVLFQWFALGFFSYLLISGFVFFIKKYRFTRFTSSIQRFWRRSYILFWLIESCLLLVFLYLVINSTQESPYMLDQINVFKTHLYSWKLFLPKLLLNTILVILGYLLLLNIKWNIFRKNIPLLLIITAILTYMLWSEFYQIYHISNFYANLFWTYDIDEKLWSLESDVRRTRIVNHYVMILYILKFWHIVLIYIFWIFLVLRANELDRLRFPIYSANFQNFIILYVMSWIFMYPWLKFIFKKFLTIPYFWFYVNNRELYFRIFFYDLKNFCENFFFLNEYTFFFKKTNFIYWILTDSDTNYLNFRKHVIREKIISTLIK